MGLLMHNPLMIGLDDEEDERIWNFDVSAQCNSQVDIHPEFPFFIFHVCNLR